MKKKSIVKNYFLNLIYQIVVMLISLITPPYLSRTIGADGIGIYGYTVSFATYFMLIASMGITIYGQREIAYVQNDKKERSKVFFELMIIRTVTTIISMLIFYLVFVLNGEYATYYMFLLFVIFATLFDITWFFKGLEDFKISVIRSCAIRILSVILIFIFIKTPEDLWKYFLIYVLGESLGNIALWGNIRKYLEKVKIKELNFKKHFKPIIVLFIPQIAMQIYTVLDKSMIGKILNQMDEVAYYEQAQKIIRLALTAVTSLSAVMLPRISNIISEGTKEEKDMYLNKAFNFASFLIFPMIFGIIGIADGFVPWYYGEGFEKVAILLIFLSPIIFSIGFNDLIGMQYLIAAKKQNIYTKTIILGAIVNIVSNFILIPIYKSIGAAIASVFAETTILIVQYIYVRKEINIKPILKKSIKYFSFSFFMGIIICVLGRFMKISPISTVIEILVGVIIYLLLLILTKDDAIKWVVDKIKSKVNREEKNEG